MRGGKYCLKIIFHQKFNWTFFVGGGGGRGKKFFLSLQLNVMKALATAYILMEEATVDVTQY